MKAAASRQFVLDASVAVAWCFEDEADAKSERVLDLLSAGGEALVPAIWPLEVANALLVTERRGRIAMAQATALLQRIAGLPISVDAADTRRAFEQVLPLARQQNLTQYDAAYLELAMRRGVPLATLDERLRKAAELTGLASLT